MNQHSHQSEKTAVRVRFAPSPTGQLHIGNLRTALFNFLFARHHNGTFLVRIEDTDRERSRQEHVDSILQSLAWVSIEPDESIMIQSERVAEHERVVHELLAQGKAYKCYCTEQELQARAGDNAFFSYDGHCRVAQEQPGKSFVIRFRLPDFSEIAFDDLIRGRIAIARDQLDDFIIVRSDGTPVYNLVVVLDDAFMNISHVIRGEDHISNTPKQILLYQACGYAVPQFAHMPLILGPSGDRLSKRDGAVSVPAYKQMGYLPDAFVNYLARLGWAHGDQEIFSRTELIDLFTLDAIGKKGSIFDIEKLNWLNGVYLREMSADALLAYINTELIPGFQAQYAAWEHECLLRALDLYKGRVVTIKELVDEIGLLYRGPSSYDESDMSKWMTTQTGEQLERVTQVLMQQQDFSHDALASSIKELAATLQLKFAQLAQPIRIALIGKSHGPGVFDMLALVGKEESIARLRSLQKLT